MKLGYKIWQIDIIRVFQYRVFDKIIYMEQPHLFDFDFELVCHLHKVLYGLKQVSQVWYQTLANFLRSLAWSI